MTTILISNGQDEDTRRQYAFDHYLPHTPFPSSVLDGNSLEKGGIDELKVFRRNISLNLPPQSLQHHFLFELQHFSKPALESILKITEEPPPQTRLILTIDNHKSLPPTILSRCLLVKLSKTKNQSLTNLFNLKDIGNNSYTTLSKLSAQIVKSQEQAVFVETLCLKLISGLTEQPNLKRAQALDITHKSLILLKSTNLNSQLIIENLLFSLKKISHSK